MGERAINTAEGGRLAVVTGAGGFIGGHLVKQLLETGWRVRALDSRSADDAAVRDNVRAWAGHPRVSCLNVDLAAMTDTRHFRGADAVFHFAGTPGVRGSWGRAFQAYCRNNVVGTNAVMDASVEHAVPRVVVASSSSVYGDAEGPCVEDQLPAPRSPYAVSKLAAEHVAMTHAARPDAGVRVVVLRYFTVYGPRQRNDMLFHRVLTSIARGDAFELYGDGGQSRDFTFVDDVIRATVMAATATTESMVLNVGGGATATIREALSLIEDITGCQTKWDASAPSIGDVAKTSASIEKIQDTLGWKPLVDLRAGLHRHWAAITSEVANVNH